MTRTLMTVVFGGVLALGGWIGVGNADEEPAPQPAPPAAGTIQGWGLLDLLLHTCGGAERLLRRLDEDYVFVGVYVDPECPVEEAAMQELAEGEFLRGRLKTARRRSPGQFASEIAISCLPGEQFILYSLGVENKVFGFGQAALLLWSNGTYGSVHPAFARNRIREATREIAEVAVTEFLKRQQKAQEGEPWELCTR